MAVIASAEIGAEGSENGEDSDNVDMELQAESSPQYPWDSSNPNVRQYYDQSSENIVLDQIIEKEVESIEKIF